MTSVIYKKKEWNSCNRNKISFVLVYLTMWEKNFKKKDFSNSFTTFLRHVFLVTTRKMSITWDFCFVVAGKKKQN